MGFFDAVEQLAASQISGQSGQSGIAGALMQAVQEQPGGISGILQSFEQNGLGAHAQDMAAGQTSTTTPQQVQQGLAGTGLIESVAEKAGVSPEVATIAVTTLMPMVLAHFAPNGQAAPQDALGGLAQQFLSKVL